VRTPIVLHPDQKGEVKTQGGSGLKDWTILVMPSVSGDLTQMTICRPIGIVPGTTAEDYVMIPSDHIKSYISAGGVKSQLAKSSEAVLATAKTNFLIAKGLYKRGPSEIMWGDKPVATVWREAAVIRTDADKKAKEAYYTAQAAEGKFLPGSPGNPGKGDPAKTCKPYASSLGPVEAFLPKEMAAAYAAMNEAWKASSERKVAEAAKIKASESDPTLGGPDGTTPQRVIHWLRGVPPSLVKSYILRAIFDHEGAVRDIRMKYHAAAAMPEAEETG